MVEDKNKELLMLPREEQLLRMGIPMCYTDLIFKLECVGMHQEASGLILAITNPKEDPSDTRRLAAVYQIKLDTL